jgi:hypothetical protein
MFILVLLTLVVSAGAQTLALGDIMNRDQSIVLAGANTDAGITLFEHGFSRIDGALIGLKSLQEDDPWWAVGAGLGLQPVRPQIVSIAWYPTLFHFRGEGWNSNSLSLLTVASRMLVTKGNAFLIAYTGVNPGYSITNRKWSLDALPIGFMVGSWKRLNLFGEYDLKTEKVAVGIMWAINDGIIR